MLKERYTCGAKLKYWEKGRCSNAEGKIHQPNGENSGHLAVTTLLLVTALDLFTLKVSPGLAAEPTGHRDGYSRDALKRSQADGWR